ncbi:MAG TPA: hypothetical protein VF141_21800 [Chryseolinea sp.]
MIRFFVVLLVAAGVTAGLTILALHLSWINALPSFFYQILLFLVFATFVVYRYLYNVNKPDFFVQLYLLTMVVKFIAYGVFNLIVILEDRPGAAPNVAFFLVIYLLFTALEVAFLYRKISRSERP